MQKKQPNQGYELVYKTLAEKTGDKNWLVNINNKKHKSLLELEDYDDSHNDKYPDPFDGDPTNYWNID